MNTASENLLNMTDSVRALLSAKMGTVEGDSTMYGKVAQVVLCIEASLHREANPGNQHWFVVTSVKALRAAYHGKREDDEEGTRIPNWPVFTSDSAVTEMIRMCASSFLGVELRFEDDDTTVVILNMKLIRGRGYRLSHIKFTEPLMTDSADQRTLDLKATINAH